MSRPPSTYAPTFADAAALAAFVAAAGSLQAPGANLHLLGIEVGTTGTLAGTFAAAPANVVATFSRTVIGGAFYEFVVSAIDGDATTAWPLTLYYGPLGVGAR